MGAKIDTLDRKVPRLECKVTSTGPTGPRDAAGRTLRAGLKVLFITGYADNAVIGDGHLDRGMQVLTKPFSIESLAVRIRSMVAEA